MLVNQRLIVQDDLTWYIHVKAQRINSDRTILATLPQSVNSLSCLNKILAVVDTCTVCLGNDDETFRFWLQPKNVALLMCLVSMIILSAWKLLFSYR